MALGSREYWSAINLNGAPPDAGMSYFPVVASLYKIGVGVGPLVACLNGWSLFGLQRFIM